MADEKISLGDLLKEEPKEKQTKKVSLGDLLKEEPVKKKELALPSTDFSASSQFLQEKPTTTIPFKTGVEVEKPKVKVNRENIIKRAEAGEVNPDLKELADLNQRLIKGGVLTAGEIERGELDKGDIDDFTLRTRALRDLREKSVEKSKALETGAKKLQQQGQTLIQEYSQAPSPELKSQIEQLDKDYQLTVKEYNKERYKQDIYEKRLVQTSDSIKKLANESLPTGFFEGAWKRIKENPKEFIEYVDLFKRSKAEQIQFAKDAYLKMPTKEQDLFSRGSMGQIGGDVLVDGMIALGFSLAGSPVAGAAAVSVKQGAIQAGEDFVRAFNQAKEEGIATGEYDRNGKPIMRIPSDDEAYDIATKAAGVGFGTGTIEGLAGVLTGGAATKVVGKVAEKALPKVVAKVAERGTDVAQDVLLAGGLQTGRNAFDRYQGLQTELLAGVPQNMLAEGFLSTVINVPGAVKDIKKIKASEAAKAQIFESVVNAKDNPEELKKLTENLEIIKNQGLVTESEYNDIVKKVQQYEQALPTIPEEIKNKKAAADLIIERNDLAEKAQTVDEAYKKPIEERIKQINEELLKVDEKAVTPPPAAEVTLPEVEVTAEKPAPTEPIEAQKVEIKEEPKEVVAEEVVTEEKPIEEVAPEVKEELIPEITEQEYSNFIDKGIVTEERLNNIAEKVKNQEILSDKEQAIFTDKTSDINRIISESEFKDNEITTETEVEKKDRVTRLKDKVNKLKESIKGFKYEQRWKDAEAKFMKEYELAKQKGASDAKLKEMTDKYKSKVKSLEEELKQEKKERRYELKYLEAEANTVKDWLGENKSLLKGLTDAEYQRLTKKLTGTGLRSDIDDVMEYLDKMVGNADYNNKLSQAKKLNKGLKLLSKSKSTLVNEREALKKFISVKPSSSWDVAKLDEYNKFAKELIDSVSPVKNVKGKPERKTKTITTEQIDNKYETLKNDYDNEVLSKLIKDNAWYFINKKFTIEDIDKIKADLEFINGKDLDAQKQALERLDQRKEFKEAMKEIVFVQIKKITNLDKAIRDGFSKDENSIIDRLKNIDVKKLNTKQLIKINNILNNIETNGDFSDAGYVDVIAKFQKAIPKIDGILKNSNLFKFKNTKIWDTIRTKRSLDAIMQRLTLVNRTAASKLNVAFGDTDLSLNNVKVNDFVKKVLETIQKYEDTKPSVKDEHTNEVVAYLIQNTATTDKEKEAQFKQAKDNLKTSYENLKKGNKDEQNLGKLQEEIYKDLDLDNVNNQQQLIDKYSKMNKTAMDYLFKMQKVYEEIEPLFRKNQELYNNTTYPKIQYYTPIKHRTLSTEVEEDLKGEEEYLKSSMGINASMSKSSIKRVGMNKNQYIDTDFNKLMYTRANDIANQAYTLPDRAFMHELFNSKEFLELFGEENARVLRDAFESKVNHVMNKYPIPSKTQKKINDGLKPLDRIINLSSVRALNGALQSVKQMVVLVNTISDLTLSGNADLIDKSFKAKWDKSFETFLKRMPISLREGTKGGTNLSKDIDEITESKIRTELENLYKAYGLATENMAEKTLYFLRKGDSFPAELSWAAYYMESLKNQGIDVDNINWEEENNKINDGEESRKEAIAYAEAKVSSKQNVSDPANVSELIANKDVLVRIVRSLIAPLSSYAINTRNRLNDDLLAIAKGGDKKAAVIDITATLAELYAYGVMINVISAFILEPAMEMMLDEFGFDPEKDPREWDEILKDIFTKKAAWNAMADFLTTGTTIFGEKYGKDALNSIYTALNGKTKNANDYFNITPEESKKNEKEQNDYDRTLPFRTKTLTETFGKAGTLGILLDLSTNALSSLSYVYDDEARMKEGVRLGKTRVEGLKKGEFEKSFISPVELTPNEEKFFVISGMISASTMLIPMFSEITSVNRMAYQKAIRQAKAKYGEPERTSAGEPFAKKEPTGFYTNVFKLMDEKENLLKSGLSSSVKNEKLKEIDEKLKREYMRRAGVNEVKQEQFSRFLRDLTRQRGERIKRGLR